jgi:lipoprotein-anchoring transpeptidase ErfK/SrfK
MSSGHGGTLGSPCPAPRVPWGCRIGTRVCRPAIRCQQPVRPTRERGRCVAWLALAAALCPFSGDTWQQSGEAQTPADAAPTAAMHYTIEPVPRQHPRAAFTAEQLGVLEKLNRVDVAHMDRLPSLVVPQSWLYRETDYSPLPLATAWATAHGKALIVHQPSQAFGAFAAGQLIRWGPVSTGREGHPTPSGFFHLNWKSQGRPSTIDPDWFMPWYFNFHNTRGLAFHEYALPGRPASHACIRLLERDARWLYDWGEEWVLDERGWKVRERGTPVWIVGQYDFDAPPPWRSLHWLSAGVQLSSLASQ